MNTELLNIAIENGIIDLAAIEEALIQKQRESYLAKHTTKIYELSDGYYSTRIDGKVIKRKNLSDLEDIIIENQKSKIKNKFEDVFYDWINYKLEFKEIQKQTYDRYIADYKRFIKDSPIDIDIRDIDEEMLEEYIRLTIRDMQLTAKGWGKLRLILLGTFKRAKKKKLTEINIVEFMQNLDLSPKIFKRRRFTDEESVFTDEEVARITKYVSVVEPSIINYAIILAFQTGLRVGELAALTWDDVKENYITVNKTEINYTNEHGSHICTIRDNAKTDAGDRNVIILEDAKDTLAHIKALNPNGEYLFMRDGERIKSKAFTKKLERICGYEGIVVKSMHKARKTYATRLIDAGVSDNIIIRQLGHTNIKTTDTFYYFNGRTLDETIKQLSKASY